MATKPTKIVYDLGKLSVETIVSKIFKPKTFAAGAAGITGNFLLSIALDVLFGGDSKPDYSVIFDEINKLENSILKSTTKIVGTIKGSELQKAMNAIQSEYDQLDFRAQSATATETLKEIYTKAYMEQFSKTTSLQTDLDEKAMTVRDFLTGTGSVGKSFLEDKVDECCQNGVGIVEMNELIKGYVLLYSQYLIKAQLVLRAVGDNATDGTEKTANALIDKIGSFIDDIVDAGNKALGDSTMQEAILRSGKPFKIFRAGTTKVLGLRFFQTPFTFYPGGAAGAMVRHDGPTSTYAWELKKHGNAFFLKLSSADKGIDHYYGKSIKFVKLSDSTHPNHLWELVPVEPPRWYNIKNQATGKLLDHYFGKSIETALGPTSSNANHQWELIHAPAGGNIYHILNRGTQAGLCKDASGLFINVYKGLKTVGEGDFVEDHVCAGAPNNNLIVATAEDESLEYFHLVDETKKETVSMKNSMNLFKISAAKNMSGEFRFFLESKKFKGVLTYLNESKPYSLEKAGSVENPPLEQLFSFKEF